jgi:hypothetical protein
MVERPLPPGYDTPDSPANKIRDLYKSTQITGDATKRMFILFEPLPLSAVTHIVDSQPRAYHHLPGSQASSQIAFGCRLAVHHP